MPSSRTPAPPADPKPELPVRQLFPRDYLDFYGFLPLAIEGGTLRIASLEPLTGETLQDLRELYAAEPQVEVVSAEVLARAIEQAYSGAEAVQGLADSASHGHVLPTDPLGTLDLRSTAGAPPVVRYLTLLLREACEARASDVHLERAAGKTTVRLRVDGVLAEVPPPPPEIAAAVVSRLKLLAELDLAERRGPQDGRIRACLQEGELDLRVAAIPTMDGESLVLRILDRMRGRIGLEELGLAEAEHEAFRLLTGQPHGIVLSTGPTGSGKTTTLYAALRLRDLAKEKVITIEDPVEFDLPGATQIPVNHQAGLGFAPVLRSVLRHDPDVILVGEMRDPETAAIAIQAAMTGHLVLSTLHTNDALAALVRLGDLGVEPYLIASTVDGVLGQRLVRRICPDCRERYAPDPDALALMEVKGGGLRADRQILVRGRGCEKCRETGYLGRIGLFELLVMNDELRRAVSEGAPPHRVQSLARESGFRTMREDGWRKVQAGITTVEEVVRVTGL